MENNKVKPGLGSPDCSKWVESRLLQMWSTCGHRHRREMLKFKVSHDHLQQHNIYHV